jgi:hypothetical protein
MPDVTTVPGAALEAKKAAIDSVDISTCSDGSGRRWTIFCEILMFNMNQLRCSEWADRPREGKVIVSANCDRINASIRFQRNSKRAAMAICITTDICHEKLFVIVHRAKMHRDF